MTKWVVLSKSIVNSECWDISMNPFLTTYLLSDITSTVWSWDVLNRCFSHLSIQVVFLPLPVPAPTRSWVRALCQHLLWESLTFICFHFLKLLYVQFMTSFSLNQICNFSTFCWIFAMENNKLQIGLPSVFLLHHVLAFLSTGGTSEPGEENSGWVKDHLPPPRSCWLPLLQKIQVCRSCCGSGEKFKTALFAT